MIATPSSRTSAGAVAAAISACLASGSAVDAKEFSTAEIREVSKNYADCVVKRRYELARNAVVSNANNGEIAKDYRKLIIGDCLVKANKGNGARMKFGGDHYRYALAEALIRHDFPEPSLTTVEGLAKLTHLPTPTSPPDVTGYKKSKAEKVLAAYQSSKLITSLSQYGECVVRLAPVDSHALLMTDTDTAGEAAAFAKLQPTLGDCLAGDGTVKFGKSVLRGSIAINYYRLAYAASHPVALTAEAQN